MEFDEPEATGGVPILKYKAEWRALDEGEWHSRLYDAKEGRMIKQMLPPLPAFQKTFFPLGESQSGGFHSFAISAPILRPHTSS